MNPADLQPGDTILARHVQPRGSRAPVLTETTVVVEKVYLQDRFVTGRATKRFIYVKGCPEGGRTVPAGPAPEAIEFDHVIAVVAGQTTTPLQLQQVPLTARLQLVLKVDYELGEHSIEQARDNLRELAMRAAGAGLSTDALPDAEVTSYTWQVDGGPEEQHPILESIESARRAERPRH